MALSRRGRIAVLTVAGVILVGGGAAGALAASGFFEQPAMYIQDDGRYRDATQLRDAYVEAGGSCPDWEVISDPLYGNQLGTCGDSTTLSHFIDADAVTVKQLVINEVTALGATLLEGPNWIINGDPTVLDDIQEVMGGRRHGPW